MYGLILHSITRLFWHICTAGHLETPNQADGEYCKTNHLNSQRWLANERRVKRLTPLPVLVQEVVSVCRSRPPKRCVYSLLSLKCRSDRLVFCLLFCVETARAAEEWRRTLNIKRRTSSGVSCLWTALAQIQHPPNHPGCQWQVLPGEQFLHTR